MPVEDQELQENRKTIIEGEKKIKKINNDSQLARQHARNRREDKGFRSREFAFQVGRRLGRAEEKREKSGISGQGTGVQGTSCGALLARDRRRGEVHAGLDAADRVLRGGPVAAPIWAAGALKYRWLLQAGLPGRVPETSCQLRFFFIALVPVDRVTQCFAYGRSLVSAQRIISSAKSAPKR